MLTGFKCQLVIKQIYVRGRRVVGLLRLDLTQGRGRSVVGLMCAESNGTPWPKSSRGTPKFAISYM